MRAYSLLLVVLALLWIAAPSHAALFDKRQPRQMMHLDVRAYLQSMQFDQLDMMADQFRSTKSRFPDGGWKLVAFYRSFYMPPDSPDSRFEETIALVEKWRETNPTSVTAQVVLAKLWHDYAWKARGTGYADQVKATAWPIFEERIARAWSIINEPVGRSADCPERYNTQLILLKFFDAGDREAFAELLKEAIGFEPQYYVLYDSASTYLLPRWGGEEGEWQKLMERFARNNLAGAGTTIYARTVWNMSRYYYFKDMGISWDLTKAGFEQIRRDYPGSLYIPNVFAKFACLANDRTTLAQLFASMDTASYEYEVWGGEKLLNSCRSMVGLPRFRQWDNSRDGKVPDAYGTSGL